MTTSLNAEMLTTSEALSTLTPAWRELFARCPAATPFQSPDWLVPWWDAFKPGELASVTVRRGDELVALWPGYLEDGPYGRRLLPLGIGITDYLDVLIDPSVPEAGAMLVETAATAPLTWQRWELEDLAEGAQARGLAVPPGCVEESASQACTPVLLDAGDGLMSAVPATKRRKLRMAQNRALRRGTVTIEQAEVGSAADAFLRELERLHGARWRSAGEEGVLADAAVQAFQAETLPLMIEAELARLYLLSIDDRVVGAYYGFLRGERAYAYLCGYDPDFAHESPGTILVGHAIAEAERAGVREFHFLRGEEAYKASWGATGRWTTRRSFRRIVP